MYLPFVAFVPYANRIGQVDKQRTASPEVQATSETSQHAGGHNQTRESSSLLLISWSGNSHERYNYLVINLLILGIPSPSTYGSRGSLNYPYGPSLVIHKHWLRLFCIRSNLHGRALQLCSLFFRCSCTLYTLETGRSRSASR